MKKKLEPGTEILISVVVLEQAHDTRPDEENGYLVATSRGKVYVNPEDIFVPLLARRVGRL